MKKKLIIVESPTKAKTIKNILKGNSVVKATMGHICDLPENEFGVDIEKDFKPKYVVIPGKEKIVKELKSLSKKYSDIYLATDEDREGEAIAWHITTVMGKNVEEAKRVTFHEITPSAVKSAFENPRKISLSLVNAQQARRILDRIVGYTLSPFLGRYLEKGLSAGRVQSVALKLIVKREKEIENFKPEVFFRIKAKVKKGNTTFILNLKKINGKEISELEFQNEDMVKKIIEEMKKGVLKVSKVTETEKKIHPLPPFITSTLQQEAFKKYGFSSSKTMNIAQQLYEGIDLGKEGNVGLITYMRTDSPSVAKSAQFQAFNYIKTNFGKEFLPDKPPVYKTKSATAQEAHEAIRPTFINKTPQSIKKYLTREQFLLYSLIWKRFLASQMKYGILKNNRLTAVNGIYEFEGISNKIIFEGFMKVWPVKIENLEKFPENIEEGEILNVEEYFYEKDQTKPPPRYTEATLIKTLEKFGIGRPSTYAPTISILLKRGYIKRQKRSLVPLKIGRVVTEILEKFFPDIISIDFTAKMEESLDKIANGEKNWIEILKEFYSHFKPMLDKANEEIVKDKTIINFYKVCPKCGGKLVLKKGKFGIFLGCSNYPSCNYSEAVDKDVNNTGN
ncbi:MAG TPA: type I DNA topoisomerase [Firmicutes bacterium]|nr:type I DNA topoisomerase [Bacillota bacterium]